MKLNKALLNIILATRYRKQFEISHSMLVKTNNENAPYDWFQKTWDYFESIDDGLFEEAGIKKNLATLSIVLNCNLPEGIEDVEYSELHNYEVLYFFKEDEENGFRTM